MNSNHSEWIVMIDDEYKWFLMSHNDARRIMVGVRGYPYGIFGPWARWGWGLDGLDKLLHRCRRRSSSPSKKRELLKKGWNIKKNAKPEFAKKTRFQNIPLKDLLNINETQRDKNFFHINSSRRIFLEERFIFRGAFFWKIH